MKGIAGGVLALLVAFGPGSALAQTIRGQVVDSTGAPVGVGFVVIVDADDRDVVRALTSRTGEFTLTVPAGTRGPLRIRSERIGYRQAYSTPIDAGPGRTYDVRLVAARLPIRLAGIQVEDESQCRVRPEDGIATAAVWEEARKALDAASWTASQRSYSFEHLRYERTLGPRRRIVEEQSLSIRRGIYRTPFTSRHPDLLAEEGYVTTEDGDRWYYAPDAEVLRSPSFLDTHCFHVRRDRDHPMQIGLGFVPIPGRRLSDIRGTLWLDEQTSELRTLEFAYTRLPDRPDDSRVGGRIEFRPVPSGAWIVHRWVIRMPRIGTNTINVGYERRRDTVVTGFHDVGGEVVRIATPDGELLFEAPNAVVSGRVIVEDADDLPLSDAVVRIASTDYVDTTGFDGRYEIRIPAEGTFGFEVSHPNLDSLGYGISRHQIDLERGVRTTRDFSLPSLTAVLETICGGHTQPDRRAIVGVARDAQTGRPYPGTQIVARWRSFDAELTRVWDMEAEASADSLGHFALCGIEMGRTATVQATYANRVSDPIQVAFEPLEAFVGDSVYHMPTPVLKLDIALRSSAEAATLVTGIVTDAQSGNPLPGTTILVIGTGINQQADESGAFRIARVPPGPVTIVLRHPGYAPKRHDFVLPPGRVLELPLDALSLTAGGGTNR